MRFALSALLLVHAPVGAQETKIASAAALRHGWLLSLDEGQAQARRSGRPLMVVLRCEP